MPRLLSGNRGGGAAGLSLSPAIVPATATGAVAQLGAGLKGTLTFSKLSGAAGVSIASGGAVSLSGPLGAGGSASVVARVQNTSGDAIERTLTLTASTPAGAITRFVLAGDSITDRVGTGANGSYARQWAADNPSLTTTLVTQGGRGLGTSANLNDGGNTVWGHAGDIVAANPQVVTLLIGANDLPCGDASGYATRLLALATWLKGQVSGVKVLLGTITPKGAGYAGYAGHNSERATINAALRTAIGSQIDGVIPFGEHPVIGPDVAGNDTTLYYDGLHPETNARIVMRQIIGAVLDPIAAGASGANPSAFSFTDQVNAATATSYSAGVYVTGMGVGQSASASVSGAGQIARGTGAFGTSTLTVMNGDVVIARATSSANAATGVDTTITIGTRSDAYTITTVAANPVSFTAGAKYSAANGGFGSADQTVTAVFGAGRPVVAVSKDRAAPSGVKINGVAATLVGKTSDSNAGQWSVWIGASDLAAGSYAVMVSGAQNNSCDVYAGTLGNATQAGGAASKLDFAYRADGDVAGSAALTIAPNGLGVMFMYEDPAVATEPTYPNATLALKYSDGYRWVTFSSSQTPTIHNTTFGVNCMFVAGTFAP